MSTNVLYTAGRFTLPDAIAEALCDKGYCIPAPPTPSGCNMPAILEGAGFVAASGTQFVAPSGQWAYSIPDDEHIDFIDDEGNQFRTIFFKLVGEL